MSASWRCPSPPSLVLATIDLGIPYPRLGRDRSADAGWRRGGQHRGNATGCSSGRRAVPTLTLQGGASCSAASPFTALMRSDGCAFESSRMLSRTSTLGSCGAGPETEPFPAPFPRLWGASGWRSFHRRTRSEPPSPHPWPTPVTLERTPAVDRRLRRPPPHKSPNQQLTTSQCHGARFVLGGATVGCVERLQVVEDAPQLTDRLVQLPRHRSRNQAVCSLRLGRRLASSSNALQSACALLAQALTRRTRCSL